MERYAHVSPRLSDLLGRYRRRLKQHLVRAANRLAMAGMALLLLSLVSALLLILDVVLGLVPAIVTASGAFAWFATWWLALPVWSRARHPE